MALPSYHWLLLATTFLRPITINKRSCLPTGVYLQLLHQPKDRDLEPTSRWIRTCSCLPDNDWTWSDLYDGSGPRRTIRVPANDTHFFDCNSVLSDMEDLHLLGDELHDTKNNHAWRSPLSAEVTNGTIAEYRDRRVVYANGVDSTNLIPSNYVTTSGGNEAKAATMWVETQKWQRANNVWKIHS
jgi:hypothetical protein